MRRGWAAKPPRRVFLYMHDVFDFSLFVLYGLLWLNACKFYLVVCLTEYLVHLFVITSQARGAQPVLESLRQARSLAICSAFSRCAGDAALPR